MSKRITIDNVQTILEIIGEEDTVLGFHNDEDVQKALELIQSKIEFNLAQGTTDLSDVLIEFC